MANQVKDGVGKVVSRVWKMGTVQNLAFTTHAESSAVAASTKVVMLCSTAACYILTGSAPVATTSNGMYLPANMPIQIGISGGEKVSVVQASSGGTLSIVQPA